MLDAIEIIHEGVEMQAVHSNGFVYSVYTFLTMTIACDIDVTFFPYDTQTCLIVFDPLSGFEDQYKIG